MTTIENRFKNGNRYRFGESIKVSTRNDTPISLPVLLPPSSIDFFDPIAKKKLRFQGKYDARRSTPYPIMYTSNDGKVAFEIVYNKNGPGRIHIIKLTNLEYSTKGIPKKAVVSTIKRMVPPGQICSVYDQTNVQRKVRGKNCTMSRSYLPPNKFDLFPEFEPTKKNNKPYLGNLQQITGAILSKTNKLNEKQVRKLLHKPKGLLTLNNTLNSEPGGINNLVAAASKPGQGHNIAKLYHLMLMAGIGPFNNLLERTYTKPTTKPTTINNLPTEIVLNIWKKAFPPLMPLISKTYKALYNRSNNLHNLNMSNENIKYTTSTLTAPSTSRIIKLNSYPKTRRATRIQNSLSKLKRPRDNNIGNRLSP